MKIRTPIPVKLKITSKTKDQLINGVQESIQRLKTELVQLHFQEKKLLVDAKKKGEKSVQFVKNRFSEEFKKREEKLARNFIQLEELALLQEGEEILHNTVEADVEVNIGDRWDQIASPYEIILEDGIVIEIRRK